MQTTQDSLYYTNSEEGIATPKRVVGDNLSESEKYSEDIPLYKRLEAMEPKYISIANTPIAPSREVATYGHIIPQGEKSIYDDRISIGDYIRVDRGEIDLEEARANTLNAADKIAKGIAGFQVRAAQSFLASTVGTVYSIASAIYNQDPNRLANNAFNKRLEEISTKVMENDLFKIYRTEEERTNPWYKQLGSLSFWAGDVLSNLGYTAGSVAAIVATGGATSALLKTIGAGAKFANKAGAVLGNASASFGESTIEAASAVSQGTSNEYANIDARAYRLTTELDSKYRQLVTQVAQNPNISDEIKEETYQMLVRDYNTELEGIKQAADDQKRFVDKKYIQVGNQVLGGNFGALYLSNLFQFGKVIGLGSKNALRARNVIRKDRFTGKVFNTPEAAEAMLEGRLSLGLKNTSPLEIAGKGLANAITEGAEEGYQNIVSSAAQIKAGYDLNSFYGAQINPDVEEEVAGWLGAINQSLNDNYGSVDSAGWTDVFVGAITGLGGSPVIRKASKGSRFKYGVSMHGGIWDAMREAKENTPTEEAINVLNEKLQNPAFVERYKGLIRHNDYQKQMDVALQDGNEFEYDNLESSQLTSDILAFIDAGVIEEYKGFINNFKNLDDTQVEELKQQNTIEGSTENIFGTQSNEEIKKQIEDNANRLSRQVDRITNIYDYLNITYGDRLEKDDIKTLTWLQEKLGYFTDKASENLDEISDILSKDYNNIDQETKDKLSRISKALGYIKDSNITPYEPIFETLRRFISTDSKYEDLLNASKEMDFIEIYDENIKPLLDEYNNVLRAIPAALAVTSQNNPDIENSLNLLKDASASLLAKAVYGDRLAKAIQDPSILKRGREQTYEENRVQADIKDTKEATRELSEIDNVPDIREALNNIPNEKRAGILNNLAADEQNESAQELRRIEKDAGDLLKVLNNSNLGLPVGIRSELASFIKRNAENSINVSDFWSNNEEYLGEGMDRLVEAYRNSNANLSSVIEESEISPSEEINSAPIQVNEDNINSLPTPQDQGNNALTNAQIGPLVNDKKYVPMSEYTDSDGNTPYRELWSYLTGLDAFGFVERGDLADLLKRRPNLRIRFIVDKQLNNKEELKDTILLAVEAKTKYSISIGGKNYQIVGVLKNGGDLANSILVESANNGDRYFVSKFSTTISKEGIRDGFITTDNEEHALTSALLPAFNNNQLALGVMDNTGVIETSSEVEVISPSSEEANKPGTVYILIKGASGRHLATVANVRRFTFKEYPSSIYSNSPFFKRVLDLVSVLADRKSSIEDFRDAANTITKYLWMKGSSTGSHIAIDINKGVIRFTDNSDPNREILESVTLTNDINENINNILSVFNKFNARIQIDKNLLKDPEYVKLLIESEVLTTNIPVLKLYNGWFAINFIDPISGKDEQTEYNTDITSPESPVEGKDLPIYTIVNGEPYYMDMGTIYDSNNQRVEDPNTKAVVVAQRMLDIDPSVGRKIDSGTAVTVPMDTFTVVVFSDKGVKVYRDQEAYKLFENSGDKIIDPLVKENIDTNNQDSEIVTDKNIKKANEALNDKPITESVNTSNILLSSQGINPVNELQKSNLLPIFESANRTQLKTIQEALKGKGIKVRTKGEMQEAIKKLLRVDNATLGSMDIDSIISEINCTIIL